MVITLCYVPGPTGSRTYQGGVQEGESGGQLSTVRHQNVCREMKEEQRMKLRRLGLRRSRAFRAEPQREVSNISSEVVATNTRYIYTSVWNVRSVVKG